VISAKAALLAAAAVCLVCGCTQNDAPEKTGGLSESALWPVFRGDRNLSGVSDAKLPDRMKLLWSFAAGERIVSSPVIGFGAVFIGSTDGKVYSIGLADGAKRWVFDTGDDIEASPLLCDSTVYVGNLNGHLSALDALSGRIVWKNVIGGEIKGSANTASDPESGRKLVLVGSYDATMYCFDAATGDTVWTYETGYYINGAPATDGRHVVFGGCDEMLHILSVRDGAKTGEVDAGSYIAGSAALVGGRAYVGHYGGQVVCIDIGEKRLVWTYEGGERGSVFFSSPAVGDERVYIGSRDRSLHCVDRATGLPVWKFRTHDEIDCSPVIAGNSIVFGSGDGRLYMVDAAGGKEIWSYEIGASIEGCPAVIDGMVVIGADDGRVYTFGGAE